LKGAAAIYGLSTEGYRIASALALSGVPTTVIDENLQMGLQLKAETVESYPSIAALIEEEPLLGLQPIEATISGAKYVFFAPKIRRTEADVRGELTTRTKEVAKHLSKDSILFYNLPTSLGGNSDNLELLERVTGLVAGQDFSYVYAPICSVTETPTILGFRGSKLGMEAIKILTMAGMKPSSVSTLESAELLHFKQVLERYSDFVVPLELYSKMENKEIRTKFKRLPGYKQIYLDELVSGLLDLKLLAISLKTGEPLLHLATGLTRSVEGYLRYLVEEIRFVMRSRDLKASKTKVVLVWSIDRFETRGDRIQTAESLTDRLRDYVAEILNLPGNEHENPAQRDSWQSVLLGGRASLIVACSNSDFEAAGHKLGSSHSPSDIALMKANLLCELVE
jgi:hypothetical protein